MIFSSFSMPGQGCRWNVRYPDVGGGGGPCTKCGWGNCVIGVIGVITSLCIAAPGPSHLNFHLPLNSESGTGCVIWKSFTFISFRSLRCCIISPIWVSLGTLRMNISYLALRGRGLGTAVAAAVALALGVASASAALGAAALTFCSHVCWFLLGATALSFPLPLESGCPGNTLAQLAGRRSRVVPIFQLVLFLSPQACALLRWGVLSSAGSPKWWWKRHLSHIQDWMELHRAVASSSVSWRQSRWYHHLQVPSQCMPRSDISLPHSPQGLDVNWVFESSLFTSSVFSGWLAWRDEATDHHVVGHSWWRPYLGFGRGISCTCDLWPVCHCQTAPADVNWGCPQSYCHDAAATGIVDLLVCVL